MPNFDGTGPQRRGTENGRGLGPCGAGIRRHHRHGWFGRGQGRGRDGSCPFWSAGPMDQEQEKEMLTEETQILEKELEASKKRLKELEGKK